MKPWRYVDVRYLKDHIDDMSFEEIAAVLDRTSNSVSQKARKLGLSPMAPDKDYSHTSVKEPRSAPANDEESAHLDRVAGMPCAVANNDCKGPIEVHHVRRQNERRNHKQVIPLCKHHHTDNRDGYHGRMGWRKFDARYMIDTLALALKLWRQTNAI